MVVRHRGIKSTVNESDGGRIFVLLDLVRSAYKSTVPVPTVDDFQALLSFNSCLYLVPTLDYVALRGQVLEQVVPRASNLSYVDKRYPLAVVKHGLRAFSLPQIFRRPYRQK